MTEFLKNTNSLRVRFAVGFSILVTFLLSLVLIFIYVSFADFRKDEFYKRLRDKALTTFKLLIEVEQVDHDLLQVIDKNTLNSLYNEKVMIFKDTAMIYSSINDRKINFIPSLLQNALDKKEYYTLQGANEVIALHLNQNSSDYILIASAYDKFGRSKLLFLKWVMIIVFCFGIILCWISTYFFVRKVIKPLENLRINLRDINYDNLSFRLLEKGQGEEVDSLSATFNQILKRLQRAFSFQKDFVHYASHELRTPLASMISLTENTLNKQMSADGLSQVLKELFQQQKNLTNITHSLLVLSDNRNEFNNPTYPEVRLDEVLFRSVEITKGILPEAQIEVDLQGELSNEKALLIQANEPLILMAFNNLFKNGIQYSGDGKIKVIVNVTKNERELRFINAGNPFSIDEQELLFTPFFRGSNSGIVKGHGLGLPLVRQVIHLHKAVITYSNKDGLNEFKIIFPWNSDKK